MEAKQTDWESRQKITKKNVKRGKQFFEILNYS